MDDKEYDITMEYAFYFGEIAMKKGFITEQQLDEALNEQMIQDLTTNNHRLIGKILLDKGLITHHQIAIVLEELVKNKKIFQSLTEMMP